MRIEDYEHRNELGMTKSDMKFWAICLLLSGILLTVGWIATMLRWG